MSFFKYFLLCKAEEAKKKALQAEKEKYQEQKRKEAEIKEQEKRAQEAKVCAYMQSLKKERSDK